MPYLGTSKGRLINPLSDQLETSNPLLLAQECFAAISKKNRYNGHTGRPYTVGQHTLILLHIVEHFSSLYDYRMSLRKTVLFHDMHEAFTGDMPRPLKVVLPEYNAFEEKIAQKVRKCLWGEDKPCARSEKFLAIIDTDICAAFEMPVFKIGFYHEQEITDDLLVAGLQLLMRQFAYRDLIDPVYVGTLTNNFQLHCLLPDLMKITHKTPEEVEETLNRIYWTIVVDGDDIDELEIVPLPKKG